MTADGGMNQEIHWDEARLALGRVATFLQDHPGFDPAELPSLAASGSDELQHYELIPYSVRQAIEDLSPDEMTTVIDVFTTLADNHFYLESRLGLIGGY